MDRIVDKIAALGVPGLVLMVAMAATGWTGAAAVTTALAALGGPLGLLGGIATLIFLALLAKGVAKYGFERLFKATVLKLRGEGVSNEEIKRRVQSYPISSDLKLRIHHYVDTLDPSKDESLSL
jgi:hypothetical protein